MAQLLIQCGACKDPFLSHAQNGTRRIGAPVLTCSCDLLFPFLSSAISSSLLPHARQQTSFDTRRKRPTCANNSSFFPHYLAPSFFLLSIALVSRSWSLGQRSPTKKPRPRGSRTLSHLSRSSLSFMHLKSILFIRHCLHFRGRRCDTNIEQAEKAVRTYTV